MNWLRCGIDAESKVKWRSDRSSAIFCLMVVCEGWWYWMLVCLVVVVRRPVVFVASLFGGCVSVGRLIYCTIYIRVGRI